MTKHSGGNPKAWTRARRMASRSASAVAIGAGVLVASSAGIVLTSGTAFAQPGGGGTPCGGPGSNPSPSKYHVGDTLESLLANPSPAADSSVVGGQTLTILYTDETPIADKASGFASSAPTATLYGPNGYSKTLTVTVTPTAAANGGCPPTVADPTYVDSNGGSENTYYQDYLTMTLPDPLLSPGKYHVDVTVHDTDGNEDSYDWPMSATYNGSSVLPFNPAIGGGVLAVALGGGLLVVQRRRRRPRTSGATS